LGGAAGLEQSAPAVVGRQFLQCGLFRQDEDGNQWPMMNVFVKDAAGAVTHSWGSELFLAPPKTVCTTAMWTSYGRSGISSI
jgi:hypothetical protein